MGDFGVGFVNADIEMRSDVDCVLGIERLGKPTVICVK